jgi:hypothetical protein
MKQVVVTTDVSDAVGLGEQLETVATVVLPDAAALADPPVVCFGFPGGGYSRGYFTFDMPGAARGGEAGFHVARGWVFVAVDHLTVGDSSSPSDLSALSFERLAAANDATVAHVLGALRDGTVAEGYPPVGDATVIGIGQSMGGCLTIVAQGHHATFDAIGVLGFSAIHTVLAMPPGVPPPPTLLMPRGTRVVLPPVPNVAPNASATPGPATESDLPPTTWGFHYDDEPRDVVVADMVGYPLRERTDPFPEWASRGTPPCAATMLSPGVVAPEAAAVTVAVLVAVGERDVCPQPRLEPSAYKQSTDVTVFVCPRMSHMHNFAGTREIFWERIHTWGGGVAHARRMQSEASAGPR